MSVDNAAARDPWVDDLLDRRYLATFLTQSILASTAQDSSGAPKSLTVALDADWGAGKTFFVTRWIEELRRESHPVVYFDAWANDLGDEPSVALMSAILSGLSEWKERLPKHKALVKQADALKSDSIRKLRSAVVPVATVVAKGLVKKLSGIAVDELFDAASAEAGEVGGRVLDEALDKFFEVTLAEHSKRAASLGDFRATLRALLELIVENTDANFPFFVFIDELDRCRPSYSVKLLEEVKHIFGVPGVVFVVSTNIDQLQNSVRGSYGGEFDGRRYLRRFFDKEFVLPRATQSQQVRFALAKLGRLSRDGVFFGMPKTAQSFEKTWAFVAEAMFPSDLRGQLQALAVFNDLRAGMGGRQMHLFWMFYLCGLYVKDRTSLEILASANAAETKSKSVPGIEKDVTISFDHRGSHFSRESKRVNVKCSEIVSEYMRLSSIDRGSAYQSAYSEGEKIFPSDIVVAVAEDFDASNRRGDRDGEAAWIAMYPSLVLAVGFALPISEG